MKKYSIVELTKDSPDELFKQRFNFYNSYKKLHQPIYAGIVEYKDAIINILDRDNSYSPSVVFESDQIVAIFSSKKSQEENIVNILITVHMEIIDNSFVSAVLDYLTQRYRGGFSLEIDINSRFSPQIREKFKFKIKFELDLYLLKREDIDRDLLEKWRRLAEKQNPDITLVYTSDLTESIIDEYSKLYTEVFNDLPLFEIEHTFEYTPKMLKDIQNNNSKNGNLCYRLIGYNKEMEIIALTEVKFNKSNPYSFQAMTGVKKEYRGRGISKWFKALIYPKLFDSNTEIKGIVTEMVPQNHRIQSVNRALGFKKIEEFGDYWMSEEDCLNQDLQD